MNQSLNYSTPYSKLYETARVSPISLTYYAYCFANGNYTISLHFAEIDFTNAAILGSSERHIFNVYIQVNYNILFSTWKTYFLSKIICTKGEKKKKKNLQMYLLQYSSINNLSLLA